MLQRVLHAGDVEGAEFVPFGEESGGIGVLHRVIRIAAPGDVGQQLGGFLHAGRIIGADCSTCFLQRRDDVEAHAVAHIIGVGLERHAQNGDGLAVNRSAAGLDDAFGHRLLAFGVYIDRGLDKPQGRAGIARGFHQRQRILGKA